MLYYYINYKKRSYFLQKRRQVMKNKKMVTKIIETIAIKVAIAEANATCPFINYQPKMPKAVKKLRKF